MTIKSIKVKANNITKIYLETDEFTYAELKLLCPKGDFKKVDDEMRRIMLATKVVDEFDLQKGQEFSFGKMVEIIGRSNLERAYKYGIWLLSKRDYSAEGLKDKVSENYGLEAGEFAAEKICEQNFIDDENYAKRLAEQLISFKKLSTREALRQMQSKGIYLDKASLVLEEMEVDDTVQIESLVRAKYSKLTQSAEGIKKLRQTLYGKGFQSQNIGEFVEKLGEFDEY